MVNDNGGTAVATDWTLTAAGTTGISGTTPVDSGSTFSAGTYALSESGPANYTASAWVCVGGTQSGSNIALTIGQSATCTITNNDISPTITIVKNTHGTPTTFTFDIIGPTASTPSITPVGDPGTGTTGAIPVNAGSYTVDEQGPPAGWTLTDLTCTAGSAGPLDSNGIPTNWSFTLVLAQNVTCTFTDSAILTTRTQGFWATHTALANNVWNGTAGLPGETPLGTDNLLCTGTAITATTAPGTNQLMGGFWSSVAKTSTGGKRSPLDQARMQMLQQYFAAVLNVHAFGSGSEAMLATARTIYCGTDVNAIKGEIGVLGTFNTSGDSGVFSPGASATAQESKLEANIPFWDTTYR